MRYYFIIVLLIYIIVKFLYDIFMSKKNMFSSNAYYMSFLISKLMFIICFISVLYSIYMGKTLSGYFGILWFITIYVSTYYIEDLIKQNRMKKFVNIRFLKYFRIAVVMFVILLFFAAIRAKYLGYY
jgi:asparagine N-glycosylation enzyme membrane subunit Stt3